MIKPYYQDKWVTIYHGDCREILPTLPKVDLVLTDPPYESEAHTPMRRKRSTVENRSIDDFIPFDCMDEVLRHLLVQTIKNITDGWSLIFCQAEAVGKYQELLNSSYRRPMVWIKPDSSPQFTGDRPSMGYETIIASWHGIGKSVWNGGGKRGVYTYNTGHNHLHETQKPIELISQLISDFAQQNATILDPFLGSGTTCVAAKNLNRHSIGIELEERYCEITVKRLQQEVMELGI